MVQTCLLARKALQRQRELEAVEPEKAAAIVSGEFTLDDFIAQIEAMSKMGSMEKILDMIPGMGALKNKMPKEMLGAQEEKMKRWRYTIQSMTKEEKQNVGIIDASRIKRISKGSGVPESEIREMLKQYRLIKKMMKKFAGGRKGRRKNRGKKGRNSASRKN